MTGGTRVLSDWLIVRVTAQPGETFLGPHDRHGRRRQAAKDAERNRANILLAGLTIIFLLVTATLLPYSMYSVECSRARHRRSR